MADNDDYYSKGVTQDERVQKALEMLRRGKSLSEIVKESGLSAEEVRELSGEY